ncbi:MAG: WXG100 family type VII secretion target [Candidatus Dormibacteraeota bacterium]|nr:WXG100 family type VII secretion target [Candidatus Dormibacteraeota bacterium]MDQ6900274.1 WXG100 family type VII secretion target [Candidatus Dormibacteraeota bacterium]
MSDGHILVTFGSVAEAAADTDSIAGQIGQQLGDLKAYLQPMIGTWSGQASGDYQALQSKWDTGAADLNLVLRQIATALRTAGENYVSAENANSSIWG